MLLRHLFHYALGIPCKQILLTSCDQNNFNLSKDRCARIYPDILRQKDANSSKPFHSYRVSYHNLFIPPQQFEFAKCVFSQVGEDQYQFMLDDEIKNIIKPFNRLYIRTFLKTNENTELFVFFLHNGYFQSFSPNDYNFFIERIYEIPAKHYIIFNESCHSGSLLELINISRTLYDIFHEDRTTLMKAFETILSYSSTSTSTETESTNKASLEDIQALKPESFDPNKYNDIIQCVSSKLSKYPTNNKIDPLLFIHFQQKASIFCSCYSDNFSFSLPIRDFYIGFDSAICSHGNIYISCVIDCLFHKRFKSDSTEFVQQLQLSFEQMKSKFEELIIEQNKYFEDEYTKTLNESDKTKTENKCSQNIKYIHDFFDTNYTNPKTFYSSHKLPDLSSLLIPKDYWPIIIDDVDGSDYDKLKLYHYIPLVPKHTHQTATNIQEVNPYAPYTKHSTIWEFKHKFFSYLRNHLPKDLANYKIECSDDRDATFQKETDSIYEDIRYSSSAYANKYNRAALQALKNDIKLNLEGSFKEHQNEFATCCKEAFQTILPLWKNVFLYC